MRLKSINEQDIKVANPSAALSKFKSIVRGEPGGKMATKEIEYQDLKRHTSDYAMFISSREGDQIIIARDDEALKQYPTPRNSKFEIVRVRELIKRLDPKTFKDDTPPRIFVLKDRKIP